MLCAHPPLGLEYKQWPEGVRCVWCGMQSNINSSGGGKWLQLVLVLGKGTDTLTV